MLSIIIVNYNTGSILNECVESLFKYENPENFEVIIVDQNSSDNSREIISVLSKKYKNLQFILNEGVRSFSFANNLGYNVSKGDYILIMNPDIIITEKTIEKLIGRLRNNPQLGAVCPLLIGKDGKFQNSYYQQYPTLIQFVLFYSIISKPFLNSEKLIGRYLESRNIKGSNDDIVFLNQIPCAFFLVKKNVFEIAGKMDEKYFLYFEDVDLSYQINKTHKIAVDKSCKVTHLGGESFKNEDELQMYSRFIISMIYFFRKNYGFNRAMILKLISGTNSLLIIILETIKKLFLNKNNYRLNKHKIFLKELIKRK